MPTTAMPADRVVAMSGALVLLSGVGSVAGPLIGPQLMVGFDIDGVLYLMAGAALPLALLAAGRSLSLPNRSAAIVLGERHARL